MSNFSEGSPNSDDSEYPEESERLREGFGDPNQKYVPKTSPEVFAYYMGKIYSSRYHIVIFVVGLLCFYYKRYYVFSGVVAGAIFFNYLFDRVLSTHYVNVLCAEAFDKDDEPRFPAVWSLFRIPRKLWQDFEITGTAVVHGTRTGEELYLPEYLGSGVAKFPKLGQYAVIDYLAGLFKLEKLRKMLYYFIELVEENVLDRRLVTKLEVTKRNLSISAKKDKMSYDLFGEGDEKEEENPISKLMERLEKGKKPVVQEVKDAEPVADVPGES